MASVAPNATLAVLSSARLMGTERANGTFLHHDDRENHFQ